MTRQKLFQTAFAAYQPEPGEHHPSALAFYRAHAGLVAAWPELDPKEESNIFHQCGCVAGNIDTGYACAVTTLRHILIGPNPERPRVISRYRSEPAKPTVWDAREEFKARFKQRNPGVRMNSQQAKDSWEANREKALAFLMQRYQTALVEYQQHEARTETENARVLGEWSRAVERLEKLRAFAASL